MEEHFYFLLALCVWFAVRHKPRSGTDPFQFIPTMFAWVASGCLFLRIATALLLPEYRGRIVSYSTHLRIDSLMFGVALSYFWQFHCSSTTHEKLYRIRYALIGGGLLLLTPAFWYDYHEHHWIFIFGFVLFYLGGGCLMLGCLKVFADRHSPPLRAVSYLGSHSYSVYLWHVPVFGWVVPPVLRLCGFTSCWPAYSVLAFCLVWGCGIVAAKLVEMPVLKLRDRLFPATTKAL